MIVVTNPDQLLADGHGILGVGAEACSNWVGSFCVADDMEGCRCPNGQTWPAEWDQYLGACRTCMADAEAYEQAFQFLDWETVSYIQDCPDCVAGEPWVPIYTEYGIQHRRPYQVARASGLQVLPIHHNGRTPLLEHAIPFIPVADPATLVGQYALWADTVEAT